MSEPTVNDLRTALAARGFTEDPEAQALAFGAMAVEKLFRGRKGHGGGPCSKRVFCPEELQAIIATAWQLGRESAGGRKVKL